MFFTLDNMGHWSNMSIAVISFMIIIILPDTQAVCTDAWTLFEEENVCIQAQTDAASWVKARAFCRNKGPTIDLVKIASMEKLKFVQETIFHKSFKHWIGLSDMDNDGTFEFVDGTLLLTSEPGLGEMSTTEWKPSSKRCVILKIYDGGLVSDYCSYGRYFLCEKTLPPPEQVTSESKKITTCGRHDCACRRSEWEFFERDKRYFKTNKIYGDFWTSDEFCRGMGGRLLMVRDEEIERFVRNVDRFWDTKGVPYWLGLYTHANFQWYWVDGYPLDSDTYQNWFTSVDGIKSCAAVVWGFDGKWRTMNCSQKKYHVCESYAPCATYPVLFVNGKTWMNKAEIIFTNEQNVEIKCFLTGYYESTITMTIICDGTQLLHITNKTGAVTFHVDLKVHRKECECQANHIDDVKDSSTFTILFQTYPHILEVGDDINKLSIHKGENFTFSFLVYANPEPRVLNVTRRGSDASVQTFNTYVEATDSDIQYIVNVNIPRFASYQSGDYHLTISNGINEDMHQQFTLQEPCDALPVLSVEKGPLVENDTTTIGDLHTFEVKCSVRGCGETVAQVKVFCDGDEIDNSSTGVKSISNKFPMENLVYTKKCTCQSTNIYGAEEASIVTVIAKKSPRFMDEADNHQVFLIRERQDISLKFLIFASPEPIDYTLTSNNSNAKLKSFVVAFRKLKTPLHYFVIFIITNFNVNSTGGYDIAVKNGIRKQLHISFALGVSNATVDMHGTGSGSEIIYLIIGIMNLLFLVKLGLLVVIVFKKRGKAKEKRTESSDEALPNRKSDGVVAEGTNDQDAVIAEEGDDQAEKVNKEMDESNPVVLDEKPTDSIVVQDNVNKDAEPKN